MYENAFEGPRNFLGNLLAKPCILRILREDGISPINTLTTLPNIALTAPVEISLATRLNDIDLIILGNEDSEEFSEEIESKNYFFDFEGGSDSAIINSISTESIFYLKAGDGKDTVILSGDFGESTILGGAGNDIITVKTFTKGISVIAGGAGSDRIVGIGSLLGGGGKDSLKTISTHAETVSMWGGKGTDTLRGGLGGDFLSGGSSNDILRGNSGSDVIIGGSGKDKLNGGAGDDYLKGDAGKDTLIGGKGLDTFDIVGKDIVKDFSPSEGDIININEALYGTNISAIDTDQGTILTSNTGLEALIKNTSSFVVQAYIEFY